MKPTDGGPTFPAPNWYENTPIGMTLRDYFAAKAMQSQLIADPDATWAIHARHAYELADAMLAERAK